MVSYNLVVTHYLLTLTTLLPSAGQPDALIFRNYDGCYVHDYQPLEAIGSTIEISYD